MNDKLQKALAIVEKYGMKGDVIYKEIEALAASKQEPQAQAGPEVVAWAMERTDGLVLDVICPDEHESHEGGYTIPLITLQSHREAMAKLQAEKDRTEEALAWATSEAIKYLNQIDEVQAVIVKKDAALDACVEALHESKQNILAFAHGFYEEYGTTKQTLDDFQDKQLIAEIVAAITQADGAQG